LVYIREILIDTPGVGDTRDKEEINMFLLYQHLAKLSNNNEYISAIVLVAKFPTLLDNSYLENLKFYQKLFSNIFQTNLVIMITHVEESEDWIRRQERSGHTVGERLQQIRVSIQSILNLSEEISYYTIDSLCFKDTEEMKHALEVRSMLFDSCFEQPITILETIRFPKLQKWKSLDEIEILGLEERKKEYIKECQLLIKQ